MHAKYLRCKHIPHFQQRLKVALLCRKMNPLDRLAEVAANPATAIFVAEPLIMIIAMAIAMMATEVTASKGVDDECWDNTSDCTGAFCGSDANEVRSQPNDPTTRPPDHPTTRPPDHPTALHD